MAQQNQTPLHDWHAAHQGKMVDFAGWSMPVMYSSIVEEHRATRSAVGIFDISHMGRLRLSGRDVANALDRLLTRKILGMGIGRIRYSLVTNERGGILDDVLVYRLSESGVEFHFVVVNAGNRDKIVQWMQSRIVGMEVRLSDETHATAMVAIQGPGALGLLQPLYRQALDALGYYTGTVAELRINGSCESRSRPAEVRSIVSRTGYTGEDGVEIILPAEHVERLWECLIERGACPVGLGARDTLRLEAAMPLYGHELNESVNPFEAGLGFAVNLEARDFVGRDALMAASQSGARRRIGLELHGKRVPREHYSVFRGDTIVGQVTSGTFSPTLQRPIAMAYVDSAAAEPGTELHVDIRGGHEPARVVRLPFYSRPK